MTTRIEKDYTFNAAVYFGDKLILNNYDLILSMVVETDSMHEQNIAMERLDYFLEYVFDSCILIESKNIEVVDLYQKAKLKLCILPEEPYDQIVGMILLLKLNSILEGRLIITDLVLSSKLSDHVRFNVVAEVAEDVFPGDYWYNNNTCNLFDLVKPTAKKGKIVKLFNDDWAGVGLSWKEAKNNTQNV